MAIAFVYSTKSTITDDFVDRVGAIALHMSDMHPDSSLIINDVFALIRILIEGFKPATLSERLSHFINAFLQMHRGESPSSTYLLVCMLSEDIPHGMRRSAAFLLWRLIEDGLTRGRNDLIVELISEEVLAGIMEGMEDFSFDVKKYMFLVVLRCIEGVEGDVDLFLNEQFLCMCREALDTEDELVRKCVV
jgi:hypothetical protein